MSEIVVAISLLHLLTEVVIAFNAGFRFDGTSSTSGTILEMRFWLKSPLLLVGCGVRPDSSRYVREYRAAAHYQSLVFRKALRNELHGVSISNRAPRRFFHLAAIRK